MGKKILLYSFLVAILALIIWVAVGFYKAYQPKNTILQGEIATQSYSISSKLPGRISEIYVKKGELVHKGDKIFSIYSPEVEAKLKQALAAKEAAQAQKEQAYNGARKEQIEAAKQQYKKAKAAEMLMEKTYKRIERLYKAGVLSEQKKDEVYTKYIASKHTTKAAYEMMSMAEEGARVEQKKAANAQEKVYASKVDEVQSYIKEQNIYSFHRGEVSAVLIHKGELTPSGFPVVMINDMDDFWGRVFVREDMLKYFKKGATVTLAIPALGTKQYSFKVSYIAAAGEYATWKSSQNGKGFDLKSFEVELRAEQKIPNIRSGMSILIELPTAE